MADRLLGDLFGAPEAAAALSDTARLQAMLDFEAALARAEARVGVAPSSAVAAIAGACTAETFDLAALGAETALAGNPAIPLVKHLTAKVAAIDAEAARWVHWGATSQDVIDTGTVLQIARCAPSLLADIDRLDAALARLAREHAGTVMPGRTLLQHALPVTFGLKAAAWLSALRRSRLRLGEALAGTQVIQFGGAAGTLAALGDAGLDVAEALAAELGLALPSMPWHAQRDRFADLACAAGVLVGVLGKMARDLSLMMQTEVGEAFEPAGQGKGGSSTMPHKRNPVAAVAVLAAATRVPPLVSTMLATMVQEHERGVGGWHAEWETLPQVLSLTAGALHHMALTMEGLEVDARRMAADLDATRGLLMAEAVTMALAEKVGKQKAHHLVEAVSKRAVAGKLRLADALTAEPAIAAHLTPGEIVDLTRPESYLGVAERLIGRVLDSPRG